MSNLIDTTIGEQLTLQRGFDITKKQQQPGDVPVVSSGGISSYHNEAKVQGPGVVLGRKGSLGTVFFLETDFWPHDTSLWVRDFKGNNPRFVYYFFFAIADKLKKMDVGAANPALNRNHVHPMDVQWPTRDLQDYIVEVLSKLDDKAALNEQTNQTLEQIAQAIFKSWFVDFEPSRAKQHVLALHQRTKPTGNADAAISEEEAAKTAELAAQAVISGSLNLGDIQAIANLNTLRQQLEDSVAAKLVNQADAEHQQLVATARYFPSELTESELGNIPKDWEIKSLDQIAHYQNGLALQKFRPENEHSFLPVVKIAQLKKGFADGEEKAAPDIKPECIINNGDVVFSWSGSLVVDLWCGGKAALNQHLFKVTSSEFPKWFYYNWTKHHLAKFQQIAADKAVTMGHIKRSHLKEALCIVPKQLELVTTVAEMIDMQVETRLQNVSLEQLRDTLLPKLLSGELAVNVVN